MKRIVAYKSYYEDFMASLHREEQLKIRRVLALFSTEDDGDTMVVLFNCFLKKTQKIPKKEIETAQRLKKEYDESK